MVVKCQIDFDNNPHGTYFAGQVLTGKVTLTADKPKKVQGVSLKISGCAKTTWSESTTHSDTDFKGNIRTGTATTYFSGREDYIASLTYLLGFDAGNESNSLVIAPGIHTYNFACHIPINCPTSFEGKHGQIRYIIKVALIRPWKFDQTFTKGFTVLKIMDLNYDSPLLRVPANSEIQKSYCCGPCRSDPMTIHVSVAQSGFVPGQKIPITVTVTNDSNVPVEEIQISLAMLVCFYSETPYKSSKNDRVTISRVKGPGVQKHCKKIFNYELPVPATPPTCFNVCSILQVAYEIFVESKVTGMHSSQVIGIPVTIGNVPLMGVIQQQPMSNTSMQRGLLDAAACGVAMEEDGEVHGKVNNEGPSAPTTEAEYSAPWSSHANIPPPSYEEAMHAPRGRINEDEKHDFGESDFAPLYPVFNMTSIAASTAKGDEIDGGTTTNGTWL